MSQVRIFCTDSNGNSTLLKTILIEKGKKVGVVTHASEELLEAQSRSILERAKRGFEELAQRNPAGVLAAIEECEKAKQAQ